MLTDAEIQRIKALVEAAPPGPWRWFIQDGSGSSDPGYSVSDYLHLLGPDAPEEYDPDELDPSYQYGRLLAVASWEWREGSPLGYQPALGDGDEATIAQRRAMLDFIAAARTAVPALLDDLVNARRALALAVRLCRDPQALRQQAEWAEIEQAIGEGGSHDPD